MQKFVRLFTVVCFLCAWGCSTPTNLHVMTENVISKVEDTVEGKSDQNSPQKDIIYYQYDEVEPKENNPLGAHFKEKNVPGVQRGYWAVIVGISSYRDHQIPCLRYAANDAKEFYDWAISADGGRYARSRVKLLLNENATSTGIKEALFVWLKQALEEDVVIIYFAGHGSPESPDLPENHYLLPYDTVYNSIATTGFPMWDIETALKRFIKAKRVIVVADACHSGGIGKEFDVTRRSNRGIQINSISEKLHSLSRVGSGVCVISASSEKEFSQESKDWGGGHGVFTYYLLKGLKGEADYNDDDHITLGELIPYLSEQVRRETRNAQCPNVAGKFDPALSVESP